MSTFSVTAQKALLSTWSMALLLQLFVSLSYAGPKPDAATIKKRTYGLVFIRVKDKAKLEEYSKLADPIVKKHGGGIERSIKVTNVYGMEEQPDIVNIAYMDSPEAQHAFQHDPEFQKLLPMRAEAIDMVFIGGVAANFEPVSNKKLKERVYMVELASFKGDDRKAYDKYQKKATSTLGKYGFHIERSIKPAMAYGLEKPDVVNILYFENDEGMKKSRQDPDHAELEGKLYQDAVENSIWINGAAAE